MTNKEIANQFSLLSKLMDVHGEDSNKAKTYSVAAYRISQLPVVLEELNEKEIAKINGIGVAILKKVTEIIATGRLQLLENLILETPPGVLEMLKIKGLGPKKISLIWKEMGIENIGELLYACNENRLLMYAGFGKKTQENVIQAIEFYLSQQGSYLYAQVEQLACDVRQQLEKLLSSQQVFIAGDIARHSETIDSLEYVVPFSVDEIQRVIGTIDEFGFIDSDEQQVIYKYHDAIQVKIYSAAPALVQKTLFEKTGSKDFVEAFEKKFQSLDFEKIKSDRDIFTQAGIEYIPAFIREDVSVIATAQEHRIPKLIQPEDIKGIVHCHSNWSDGVNTIEQLAKGCIEKGFEYLVMSDHSKTATYAHGLLEEQIKAQHALIDELNKKLKPFKIFKSIESDILADGNLDYSDRVLSTFDLVIASVHSNLKMNEEKAMARLLAAIENPFTTILGHMTGRLLLSRRGFPVNYKKIVDACAANKVAIELNAHPRRLDMRWQWIGYALEKGVLISIDPDAHSVGEFDNTRYGVLVAQKALVTAGDNLSSFSLNQFEKYILQNRKD